MRPEGPHRNPLQVDADGLPHVGAAVWPEQYYYSAIDRLTGKGKPGKLKGEETATVEQVTVIGAGKDAGLRQANIKLRFNRNPVIGDKFSSRHGQKGVLSRLFDDVDMPFAENTGMRCEREGLGEVWAMCLGLLLGRCAPRSPPPQPRPLWA